MKNKLLILIFSVFIIFSCTKDFDVINENPNALTAADVSAKYFVTDVQTGIYAPDRYPFWRERIIHTDRYAGHTTFGYKENWWDGSLGYTFTSGYTDAVYDWQAGTNGSLNAFTNFVKKGGTLENDQFYAIALIMKGLYYQRYTDTFGMVPFTESSDPEIVTPKLDDQKTIYKGIIADLDEAIDLIGSNTTTGAGPQLLAENDLFFNGNLQDWKKLANSLKLKLALRAHEAIGEDFSAAAASEAIGNVLGDKDAVVTRDVAAATGSYGAGVSAVFGDVWHVFYGGGHWNVGSQLIDVLRDNNDPRLSKFANPSIGGTFELTKPTSGSGVALYDKHVKFLLDHLKAGGMTVTEVTAADGTITITVPEGTHYVGQPSRMNSKIKPYLYTKLFSKPADYITNSKGQGKSIAPQLVMTAAESHFLLAEAAVKGIGSGAEAHYQNGLKHSMRFWEVTDADANTFIATEAIATLSGTKEEKLAQIATQRWIALFTDGAEAWAVARDSGVPVGLPGMSSTLTDVDIYALGDLNGVYPQRMRYGSSAYNKNGENVSAAASVQGSDLQGTKLWWAKQ